jgi:hypothetical protein
LVNSNYNEKTGRKNEMHFSHNNKIEARTPQEWLGVGAKIGQLVNEWSFRDDLVVMLGDATESGAPAMFNPMTAEIEVNVETAFGKFIKPEEIGDMTKRMTHLEFPIAGGAIFHEALHARYSRWSLSDAHAELKARGLEKDFNVLHLLEEGRIEALGILAAPHNRVLLRASAMEIVMADLSDDKLAQVSNKRVAAQLCALTLARASAGVLDETDIAPILPIVENVLGLDTIARLRSVWESFQAHQDHYNYLPLLELAREWNAILEELEQGEPGDGDGDEQGQPSEPQQGEGGTPQPGGGAGEPQPNDENNGDEQGGSSADLLDQIRDALAEMADDVRIGDQRDIDDQIENEEWREEREAREAKQGERKEAEKMAGEVFGRGSEGDVYGKSNSRVIQTRKPDGAERASAVKIGQMLDKAKYRERSQTEVNAVLPPGRLRTRVAVQGAAMKARGVNTQVEAWRSTKRKHTDDPTLRVGVMVDISGSMRPAMNPMASTAWIMSEAVRRVQGKCAMVYYGNDVFATLKPGQHLTDVNIYTAADGVERFDKAFKALDGVLDLTNPNDGARLLVIVSDGQYNSEERKLASENLLRANRAGVALLWIDFSRSGYYAEKYLRNTDGKLVTVSGDEPQTKVADLIGKACAEALGNVGKRNA